MRRPRVKYTNTHIQITKYTNTAYDKVPERPKMGYIFEKRIVQGYQNYIPICRTRKYTNTNTEIQKYTNRANDEVPERPNMWYIFEKRIVQGYQK